VLDDLKDKAEGKLSENEYMSMSGRDRRLLPRIKDRLYQVSIAINVMAWLALIVALVVFHFARPDQIVGLQTYLGLERKESWSEHQVELLNYLLQSCLVMTLISIGLNQRRSRRQGDHFGINLIILGIIILISLLTLQITV
jgi:uncharacterized membrane protein